MLRGNPRKVIFHNYRIPEISHEISDISEGGHDIDVKIGITGHIKNK
jgi:hypothetical protein